MASGRRGRQCEVVEVDGVRVRVQFAGARRPTEADLEVLAEFRRGLQRAQAESQPEPAPAVDWPSNIGDTCCGKCPGATCYVDGVTGA